VAAAQSAIASKQAAIEAQQSIIEAAQATIVVDEANQTFTEQDDKRYAHLASTEYGSLQNAQLAASRIAAARASVVRDTAALATAIKQVDLLKAELDRAQATLAHDAWRCLRWPEGIARSRHGGCALTYKRQSIEVDASTSAVRAITEMPKEDDAMNDKQEYTT
jgi:hypothetical protein